MKKYCAGLAAGLLLLGVTGAAQAMLYQGDVFAKANSSSGGIGLDLGIDLVMDQMFTVSVDPNDLWSAGDLPRWSNADGLVGDLWATGSDESEQPAGTQIGQKWPDSHKQQEFTAPYGALVGKIGNVYQLLGTDFSGSAWETGELLLYYWDSNNNDNSGSVHVTINTVPEPATLLLLGTGIAGFAALLRRRIRV